MAVPSLALMLIISATAPATAQDRIPRLEPAECPFERGDWARDVKIDCRSLVVSELRASPNSRTIKLAVVILRAKEPDGTPPVVFLHGGSGGSGIRQFTRGAVGGGLDRRRDIVIYDQRGAGFSEPTLCPEYQNVGDESQRLKTRKEAEAVAKAAARTCISSLDARIDQSGYNTAESAADLSVLRPLRPTEQVPDFSSP